MCRIVSVSTGRPRCIIARSAEMLHEHRLDRLQVELGGQIHDRQIFVVELAVLFGGVAVAVDEVHDRIPGAP